MGRMVSCFLLGFLCACSSQRSTKPGGYAGTDSCRECHKEQYQAFTASPHRRYVQEATPETVIGDFERNNVLVAGGRQTRMFRRGDKFYVRTTGPDGELHDYLCERTIGHAYKQRYSTTLADGRRYVLPVQWNKNQKKWVGYHGLGKAKPGSGEFWCDPERAVAVRCAGCHGTGVRLSRSAGSFPGIVEVEHTIGCEACHGPCGDHVRDSENPRFIEPIKLKALSYQRKTDVCGKCHTRGKDPEAGTSYPAEFLPGERLLRRFEPVEPKIGQKDKNFWPDGRALKHHQQHTEFITGAHYVKAGMSCINCHDPHKGGIRVPQGGTPNDLCTACHEDRKSPDALRKHTHHDPTREGAVCVDCHMPRLVSNEQPMQLRHHGASIPNPRKTLLWGSPNACNICHNDPKKNDTPQRMIDAMTEWGVPPPVVEVDFPPKAPPQGKKRNRQ